MENNKKEKNKKIKLNKIIIILLVFIILGLLIYQSKYINYKNKSKDTNILDDIIINEEQITNNITERMLKLKKLQEKNSDIVAWIEIENTYINYPVLQSNDNSYYMTYDYEKKYNANGSIFLDKNYNWRKPSTNLLIYGHNNKNGMMFEGLLNYQEESYYQEHPIIRLTTSNEDSYYEIIAVFLSRVYDKSEKNVFRYYYFINAETEEEFNKFVKNSKEASLYDTGKTAVYGDQLLTLSTCSYHTEDGRFAIVARKLK